MKIKNKIIMMGILVIILVIIGYSTKSIPSNPLVLSAEASVYHVQSSRYPKFLEVVIDPLDVKVGDIQKMAVEVEDPAGIDSVKAEIEHDNGEDVVELELVEGVWYGEWKVHDTHSETYHTTFIAKNMEGDENSITMAWTDPCSPPLGGSWTLDSNCAVSGVDGVDNGNFDAATGYTLTIQNGGTFVWNDGKSVTLSGGSIVIANGGQLKQTNLWVADSDTDTWTSHVQYAQDASPTSGIRRSAYAKDKWDCNDATNSVYPGSEDSYGIPTSSGLSPAADTCNGDQTNSYTCADNDAKSCQDSYYSSWLWEYYYRSVVCSVACLNYVTDPAYRGIS